MLGEEAEKLKPSIAGGKVNRYSYVGNTGQLLTKRQSYFRN